MSRFSLIDMRMQESSYRDVYISRSGIANAEIDEKFTQTELGDLKAQIERQAQENKIRKEGEKVLAEKFISVIGILSKKEGKSKGLAKEDIDKLKAMVS